MGMAADAHVFWGYDLGAEEDMEGPSWMFDDYERTDQEWEDELATRLGWQKASIDERNRLVATIGVVLDAYGHYDYPHWVVRIKESEQRAGYKCTPLDLVGLSQAVNDHWYSRITRFVELLELPVGDVEPRWLLASSYG